MNCCGKSGGGGEMSVDDESGDRLRFRSLDLSSLSLQ